MKKFMEQIIMSLRFNKNLLVLFLAIFSINISFLLASTPKTIIYNDDFFTNYNNAITQVNESSKDLFNTVNLVPLTDKDIEKIKTEYGFYNSIKLSGSWYGFSFKFNANNELIGLQLSLHESIVLDYKRFIEILSIVLDMPYNDLMQYSELNKANIVESNPLTKRPRQYSSKKYVEGWVYNFLYKQNAIFDLTIDKSE